MKKKQVTEIVPGLYEKVINTIKSFDIREGDILLVHSGMDGLAATGASPKQFIDALMQILGEQGTLVFPTFPYYKIANLGTACINEDDSSVLIYNPKTTISWTGMIPNIFCKYKGVIRSQFPYDTLAALGPHAEEMMRDNLKGDLPMGKNSSWEYCLKHHFKILYLGIPAYSSLTFSHFAEDTLDEQWPIDDWYRKQKYIIKAPTGDIDFTAKIRKLKWAQYTTSKYMEKLLFKKGLIQKKDIDGICIEIVTDAKALAEYCIDLAKNKQIFYRIPKKNYKKF